MDSRIKHSGEKGVFYVSGAASTQTWCVGERYLLESFLGEGSFSCVCLATDQRTQEKVAIKRLGNVLGDLEGAKCVLREVCILRRLTHPNICALRDAFLRPSNTGGFVLRDGNFVARSVDMYMILEYCDQGDLFHMRGQLKELEVKRIMWQLLSVVRFLHKNNVWHRDIKSANVLCHIGHGRQRSVKLCDFGSARSASSSLGIGTEPLQNKASLLPEQGMKCARTSASSSPLKISSGYKTPLTRIVCTPCYRAPEVIMSHGQYKNALDLWSTGCVYGELLQRVPYLGKSSTPMLQVAPVFLISGLPDTPAEDETYEGPGNVATRRELDALFAVVGTPPWSTIDAVVHGTWHHYLSRIQPRAPQLWRRFGAAGEVATDLLRRLLEFDPSRRATAEEALQHEYFSGLQEVVQEDEAEFVQDASALLPDEDKMDVTTTEHAMPSSWGSACNDSSSPIHSLPHQRRKTAGDDYAAGGDTHMQDVTTPTPAPAAVLPQAQGQMPVSQPQAQMSQLQAQAQMSQLQGQLPVSQPQPQAQVATALPSASPSSLSIPEPSSAAAKSARVKRQRSFFDITSPSEALAALELELADISTPDERAVDKMRDMLARECEELHITQQQQEVAHRAALETAKKLGAVLKGRRTESAGGPFELWFTPKPERNQPPLPRSEGLRPDTGPLHEDASAIGKQRLPHHADSELADRDAEKHLRAGRHGEWTTSSLAESQVKAADSLKRSSWGVTLCPPGINEAEMTPGVVEAIRKQHAR